MKHIMVPYDQSEPAERAVNTAVDLAKRYNSEVIIVACIVPQAPMDPALAASYAETLLLLTKNAEDAVAAVKSKITKFDVSVKTAVLEGTSVTDELLKYAESHQVDFIVMGSRGLGGFKKLLLGSVASGISQHSKCPVLIVK